MKKKIAKINLNPLNILKETPEQRKERIKSTGSTMTTKIVHDNKNYNRKKQKIKNRKEIENEV